MTLKKYLDNNFCFKLVCGAGNEDCEEIEKLVTLYSQAGCNIFDLSANVEVINAAQRGLLRAGITENRYLCVSLGINGDPHTLKADIDISNCKKCSKCSEICPQNAIIGQKVICKKCIGCGKCTKICSHNCITLKSKPKNLEEILPTIIDMGIDCIELHAISQNEYEINEKWNYLNNNYNGMLSVCIDRSQIGNETLINRVKRLLNIREPYTTIIQADGAPMSGGENDYKTTLQAVATADIIIKEQLPAYTILSGGTNAQTSSLLKLCNINANGVAIGSYARKIVKKYITTEDFWTNNENFNSALNIAKELVNSIKAPFDDNHV